MQTHFYGIFSSIFNCKNLFSWESLIFLSFFLRKISDYSQGYAYPPFQHNQQQVPHNHHHHHHQHAGQDQQFANQQQASTAPIESGNVDGADQQQSSINPVESGNVNGTNQQEVLPEPIVSGSNDLNATQAVETTVGSN